MGKEVVSKSPDEIGSFDPGRRDFLRKIGAGALLLVLGPYLYQQFNENFTYTKSVDLEKVLEENPLTRFYAHNAALNSITLRNALLDSVKNIEIDVISYNGKLYCAHSKEEFRYASSSMTTKQIEEQELEAIVEKVIKNGKNPAFDIKLSQSNQPDFYKFVDVVTNTVPKDRLITISGNFDLVLQMPKREKLIVVPTVGNISQRDKYVKIRPNLESNPEGTRYGLTIHRNMADSKFLNENKAAGFEANIWDVSTVTQAARLIQDGATGITTDNRRLIAEAQNILKNFN